MSLAISTVLYILVSLAVVALMSPSELARTESALADAAMRHTPSLAGILAGVALFSTANTSLIALIATSRILYGISKDKSLPNIFAKILSIQQTPWVAALAAFSISLLLLPLAKVEVVASVSSLVTMIAISGVNVVVMILRFRAPELHRPFKIPLSIRRLPVFLLLGVISCGILLTQFDFEIYAVVFLLLSAQLLLGRLKLGRGCKLTSSS